MAEKKDNSRRVIATNRDAYFHYTIHETMEAGLVLQGTEVKALRAAKVQMADSYVYVQREEAFISNLHISEYSHGNRENHIPNRTRKLLLHKKEIIQLANATQKNGMTIVPTQIYFNKGRVKVEIAIAKGKKLHDKRQTIKAKEAKREMDRVRKDF